MPSIDDEYKIVDKPEFDRLVDKHRNTTSHWLKTGKVKGTRIGGRWFINLKQPALRELFAKGEEGGQ